MFYEILFINIAIIACSAASPQRPDFEIYWNIPTFMCHRHHNLTFDERIKEFGIIGNKNDDFRGDKISILYDPGKFPAILLNTTSKEYLYRNEGVPQSGNLIEHLDIFEKHVNELIVDQHFSGLAVIDFESWRPIFRQNFGALEPYKNLSLQTERQRCPSCPQRTVRRDAIKRFEIAGKLFMIETIKLAQRLRPNAKWGYYAFPYCFGRGENEKCANNVSKENDGTKWLYDSSDIILPSVYLQEKMPARNRLRMVKGRVLEAIRVTKQTRRNVKPKIFVYYRYVFTDTLRYISEPETFEILNAIKILLQKNHFDGGIILWGSSDDLKTKKKCETFSSYLSNTLGPTVESLQQNYLVLAN